MLFVKPEDNGDQWWSLLNSDSNNRALHSPVVGKNSVGTTVNSEMTFATLIIGCILDPTERDIRTCLRQSRIGKTANQEKATGACRHGRRVSGIKQQHLTIAPPDANSKPDAATNDASHNQRIRK